MRAICASGSVRTSEHGVVVDLGCPEHHFSIFFSYFLHSVHVTPVKDANFSSGIPMNSFATGPCCLAQDCCVPGHEHRKHCPGCNGWIHMLCGQCLIEDEGEYKEDLVICPRCDPKLKGSEALPRPTAGLKSPCHWHPLYRGPPLLEQQATQPAAERNK